MKDNIYTEITTAHIDIKNLYDFVSYDAHGAIANFIGVVRNKNLGREVISVDYDVHDSMAKKVFADIALQIIKQYDQTVKIYISHFKGKLDVGGISIAIGVSSPHRREAIEICSLLIEKIKHQAPIWKKEYYIDGESEWVKGHELCRH